MILLTSSFNDIGAQPAQKQKARIYLLTVQHSWGAAPGRVAAATSV
jgi:hypothetical protein